MDYSKLRGRIVEKYGTCGAFAEVLGVSRQYVSAILRGGNGLSRETIMRWCEVLSITQDEIGVYFFTCDV